ncbi:MAG: hypothetical protein H6559_01810 [Lewinellaceae bacterium]|nr:hypothetical protein [Lewinellaceae bacterium]
MPYQQQEAAFQPPQGCRPKPVNVFDKGSRMADTIKWLEWMKLPAPVLPQFTRSSQQPHQVQFSARRGGAYQGKPEEGQGGFQEGGT